MAAYAWQPPPPGAAKAVGPGEPSGVLALSRMVAVPKDQRELKHISKPLIEQMKRLIDRTRWPVLLTYSDASLGHDGYVYRCSGWTKDGVYRRGFAVDSDGVRVSAYSNGSRSTFATTGTTELTRWVNRVCPVGQEGAWMARHGWQRVAVAGKVWASGRQAYTWARGVPVREV